MQDDYSKRRESSFGLITALLVIFLLVLLGLRDQHLVSSGLLLGSPERDLPFASRASFVAETPELVLVGGSSLRAATPPGTVTPQVLGAITGGSAASAQSEIIRYRVEKGDTVASLALEFSISEETVVSVNDLARGEQLKEGDVITLLPVSGALHLVRPSDTLSEISLWYGAAADEIVKANGLASASEVFAGDLLIIPGGTEPAVLPQGRLTPIPNSYFIYPIPAPHRVTQGRHPFNAVDFSNGQCGESVYAAAGGEVQRAGYTSLGGRYVRILHPNGVVTYYGHLASQLVALGQRVNQGQVIGYTGATGYTVPAGSAGCHLHFEVRGATNPFPQ